MPPIYFKSTETEKKLKKLYSKKQLYSFIYSVVKFLTVKLFKKLRTKILIGYCIITLLILGRTLSNFYILFSFCFSVYIFKIFRSL